MFRKKIADLLPADIAEIVRESLPESSELEFKETLPSNDSASPWLAGGNHIGDKARNSLLEEIIAFSNAFGGFLILGIRESDDAPGRAVEITPIPRCIELADRLRMHCRDCIDPQIPMLEISGVNTTVDGSGVVVIKVPPSRYAPHRHTVTRECYVRRADRTEKMDMREIQELTIRVRREAEAIETRFVERQSYFRRSVDNILQLNRRSMFAMRATAISVAPVYINEIQRTPKIVPPETSFSGVLGQEKINFKLPVRYMDWKPILRGVEGNAINPNHSKCITTILSDGLVEYLFIRHGSEQHETKLYVGWFMGMVASTLCAVERYRIVAGAPNSEWGMQVALLSDFSDLPVIGYGNFSEGERLGTFSMQECLFPRYSVGDAGEFSKLHTLIETDFFNCLGRDYPLLPNADYVSALKKIS